MNAVPARAPTRLPPVAKERVLPTLNQDGTRRWIQPRPSKGQWWHRRRTVAYALMFVFFAIPYLRWGGKPLILLDLPRREFTLFGTTFLPTDTVLFQLLFLSAVIAIFLFTALFGRVWCGWACPQTVYMEFLFRPLERFLDRRWKVRRRSAGGRAESTPQILLRHGVRYALYTLIAMFLAHTFLGYFVGVERLAEWVRRSPVEHPTAFLVMLGTTGLILFDFGFFREQTCLVACPYGRLQSVLLDRQSLIVAYDARRGEPRMKGREARSAAAGDCVDCGMCVQTCPTGIDIRDGLQMECIHCTQCMDACDAVMAKLGRPLRLIRYGSRDALAGHRSRFLRPRTILYPAALAVSFGLFLVLLGTRADTDVTLLRGAGAPYEIERDGSVVNHVRVKITNRASADRRYSLRMAGGAGARLIAPINPLPVAAERTEQTSVFVVVPRDAFEDGVRDIAIRIDDGSEYARSFPYRLVGPEGEADADDADDADGPSPESRP